MAQALRVKAEIRQRNISVRYTRKFVQRTAPMAVNRMLLLATLGALFGATALASDSIDIRTDELPRAIVGLPYRAAIRVDLDGRCPIGGVHVSVGKGALPRGLRIDYGWIAGTPEEIGVFDFQLRAEDSCASVVKSLRLMVTGRPILDVYPTALTIRLAAGGGRLSTESFLVSSTWRNLAYMISEPRAPWLSIKPATGATPPEGSPLSGDRVTLRVDASKLDPGVYHEKIAVYTWDGANAPEVELSLVVEK